VQRRLEEQLSERELERRKVGQTIDEKEQAGVKNNLEV